MQACAVCVEIYRKVPESRTKVRACAVEMHFNMSQVPLHTEISWKKSTPQIEPRLQAHTLCETARSKCTSTFHKGHFIRKFTGNLPRPRLSPERRHTLCASLGSRNARQHFTRATLFGNLQEKCRAPKPRADFVQACTGDMHFNVSLEPLYAEIYRKEVPRPKTAAQTLCKPAPSKCT